MLAAAAPSRRPRMLAVAVLAERLHALVALRCGDARHVATCGMSMGPLCR